WDAWFDPRRFVQIIEGTVAGLGMDLAKRAGVTIDVESRPSAARGAFFVPVRIPGDVRLVLNPRGGWEDMGAALQATARLQQSVHVPAGTPASLGLLGDPSVSQGYAFLMGGLLGDPEWLEESVGMGDSAQVAFVDFFAL